MYVGQIGDAYAAKSDQHQSKLVDETEADWTKPDKQNKKNDVDEQKIMLKLLMVSAS